MRHKHDYLTKWMEEYFKFYEKGEETDSPKKKKFIYLIDRGVPRSIKACGLMGYTSILGFYAYDLFTFSNLCELSISTLLTLFLLWFWTGVYRYAKHKGRLTNLKIYKFVGDKE